MDILFFNQACLLHFFEEERLFPSETESLSELASIHKLMQCVNNEVTSFNATGVAAEVLKHTIYCLLEVAFADNLVEKDRSGALDYLKIPEKTRTLLDKHLEVIDPAIAELAYNHQKNFCAGVILALSQMAHNVCSKTAFDIVNKLIPEFQNAPASVKYRLTERVFAFEFLFAPVEFNSWMHQIGVIKSKKFSEARLGTNVSKSFQARIILLCEFILLRDSMPIPHSNYSSRLKGIDTLLEELKSQMSKTARRQLVSEWKFYGHLKHTKDDTPATKGMLTVDLTRLDDSQYLHDFLSRFSARHKRSRFWTASQHSWVGVLGASMIHLYHSIIDSRRKITRNGNNYSKSDQAAVHEETVAQIVSRYLSKNGFDSRPSSIYETYKEKFIKKPDGLFFRAKGYINITNNLNVVFPIDLGDSIYYGFVVRNTPD